MAQYIPDLMAELKPYRDEWPPDDPHANFKAEVACYTAADPLPTMENLSRLTGIPVGCLIRYVLVKYAASELRSPDGADGAEIQSFFARCANTSRAPKKMAAMMRSSRPTRR